MARWKPDAKCPVGKNEKVGRRLFDEPMLAGAKDQKQFAGLDLRHFHETRSAEFSVDRVGRSGIEPSVINYLTPKAEAASAKFKTPKRFNGWAVLKVDYLQNPPRGNKLTVVASPINGYDLDENIFHAHVVLPGVGDYQTALHLRHLFTTYGEVHRAAPTGRVTASDDSSLSRIWASFLRQLERFGLIRS
jgi:hypothetical protein